MEKENFILVAVIASIGGLALSILILLILPPSPPKVLVRPDIPDSVLIEKTRDLEEVKAFATRYPDADVYVYRQINEYGLKSLMVSHSINRFSITGETWNRTETGLPDPSASIGIWLDPDDLSIKTVSFR